MRCDECTEDFRNSQNCLSKHCMIPKPKVTGLAKFKAEIEEREKTSSVSPESSYYTVSYLLEKMGKLLEEEENGQLETKA